MHANIRHADFPPVLRTIITVKYTTVVLLPEMVRLPRAASHKMGVMAPLCFRIRQIVHQHTAITPSPRGLAAIGCLDHTGRRYRNMYMIRIARINNDGMNARFEHAVINTRRRAAPAVQAGLWN